MIPNSRSENILKSNQNPVVSIACLTFNHEKFIEKTIDSFFSQKTNFSFEIVVGDGGSTDNNKEILRKYQNIHGEDKIKLLFPEKDPGIGGMLNQIFLECRGEFICFCEGDDYWVNDDKIERQVSFLRDNSDYVLLHSDLIYINSFGQQIEPFESHFLFDERRQDGIVFETLLQKGIFIYAPTVCFRSSALSKMKLKTTDSWFVFDYWYWLLISLEGKFLYQKVVDSVYRRHENGVTQNFDFFKGKYLPLKSDIILHAVKNNNFKLYKDILLIEIYKLWRNELSWKNTKRIIQIFKADYEIFPSFAVYFLSYWKRKIIKRIL